MECQNEVDWERPNIIGTKEKGLRQRKVHVGIKSLRDKHLRMRGLTLFVEVGNH